MCTTLIEALTPLDRTSRTKMYKNNARSRLFSRIAKRSILNCFVHTAFQIRSGILFESSDFIDHVISSACMQTLQLLQWSEMEKLSSPIRSLRTSSPFSSSTLTVQSATRPDQIRREFRHLLRIVSLNDLVSSS